MENFKNLILVESLLLTIFANLRRTGGENFVLNAFIKLKMDVISLILEKTC